MMVPPSPRGNEIAQGATWKQFQALQPLQNRKLGEAEELALTAIKGQEYGIAIQIYDACIAVAKKERGETGLDTLDYRRGQANVYYYYLKQYTEADDLYQQILTLSEQAISRLGAENDKSVADELARFRNQVADIANARIKLSKALEKRHKLAEAATVSTDNFKICRRILGMEHGITKKAKVARDAQLKRQKELEAREIERRKQQTAVLPEKKEGSDSMPPVPVEKPKDTVKTPVDIGRDKPSSKLTTAKAEAIVRAAAKENKSPTEGATLEQPPRRPSKTASLQNVPSTAQHLQVPTQQRKRASSVPKSAKNDGEERDVGVLSDPEHPPHRRATKPSSFTRKDSSPKAPQLSSTIAASPSAPLTRLKPPDIVIPPQSKTSSNQTASSESLSKRRGSIPRETTDREVDKLPGGWPSSPTGESQQSKGKPAAERGTQTPKSEKTLQPSKQAAQNLGGQLLTSEAKQPSDKWLSEDLQDSLNLFLPRDPVSGPAEAEQPKYVRRVRIAILDTGVDLAHPHVRKCKRIKATTDFTTLLPATGKGQGQDVDGHGTFLTMLLHKVAPEADIYVARVFERRAGDSADAAARALQHAAGKEGWDVDIVVMSFGFLFPQSEMEQAILAARLRNKLMFAAASNEGANDGEPRYPARDPNVFCIHSTDSYGSWTKSNTIFSDTDYSTLGEDVKSTAASCRVSASPLPPLLNDTTTTNADSASPSQPKPKRYERQSGTSVAAAIAAGIAALILEFARMPALDGAYNAKLEDEELDELHTAAGMARVFKRMALSDRNSRSNYLRPGQLITLRKDKDRDKNRARRGCLKALSTFLAGW